MHLHFAPCSLQHFENKPFFSYSRKAKRFSGWDEVEFTVQHKISQMIEYSNNNDENFKELSTDLNHRGENKLLPASVGGKNALD